MKKITLLAFGVCTLLSQIHGQQLLVLEDRAGLLDDQTTLLLEDNLNDLGFVLVYEVDFRNKCDYLFAKILPADNGYILEVESCEEELIGSKMFKREFEENTPEDQSLRLASYLLVLGSSSTLPILANMDSFYTPGASVSPGNLPANKLQPFPPLANEHHSRYYFSPSAYNLRKNEFYYNTLNFVIHDIQYGFSDNFSLGLGSSVAFIPIYVTPKLSFKLGEKHHLAVGDLFGYGSWGLNNYFNLGYVAYTYGGLTDNVTIGAGFLSTDYLVGLNSRPVFSLSATTDFGRRLFLVTEHYVVPRIATLTLSKYDSVGVDPNGWPEYQWSEIDFNYSAVSILGFLGVRFVNKNENTKAFQFGVGYFLNLYEDGTEGLTKPPYAEYGYIPSTDEFDPRFYLIPTMNFTYKFGKPID